MPPTTRIVPMFTGAPGKWSVSRARRAIDAHEIGDLSESALLAKACKRYHRIAGALNTRTGALKSRAGLPFQVEKSDRGDQRRAQSVADRTRDLWWDVCPETTIALLHEDAIQLERAFGCLTWQSVKVGTRTEWIPLLHHLPAEGATYREDEGAWYYQTRDGQERITPGDGRWFMHEPAAVRPPFGGSVLVTGPLYVIATYVERDFPRWTEKLGLPILAVEEPAFASDDVEATASATAFYEQFKKLGTEAVFRLPKDSNGQGWQARWLEASGTGWQGIRALGAYAGDASEYAITGMTPRGDQPLGGDGESVRERVRVEYLAADAEPFTNSLRDQVWKPYGRFNVEGWEDDIAAWGRWDTRPPADLKARAEILTLAAETIPKLVALGADPIALLDEFRVPRPKKTTVEKAAPEVAPGAEAAPAAAPEDKPIPVTPTDLALAFTINEVRQSYKFGDDAKGGELVAERRARLASVVAEGAAAEKGEDPAGDTGDEAEPVEVETEESAA